MANYDKLKEFIKPLPTSAIAQAICLIVGSLATTCTDEDMDMAIEVAKEGLEKLNEMPRANRSAKR